MKDFNDNIDHSNDGKPPLPIVINNNDVFLQTEEISLTSEINEYRIRLNSNYKYCNGVMITTNSSWHNEIFGIKEKGNYILDAAPVQIYLPSESSGILKRFVDFFTDAKGSYKNIYFDKRGSSLTNLKLIFLLSNNPSPSYVKRHLGFDKIIINSSNVVGRITFNNNFKFIKKIYFIKSDALLVNPTISLRDENRYFLDQIAYDDFFDRLSDIDTRFIPVYIVSNNVFYDISSTSGSGFIYIVYEYED